MTNRNFTNTRFLVVIALLLVQLGMISSVGASYTAVDIYDHGFAEPPLTWTGRGHAVVNKVSNATQDDVGIYAYATAAYYAANFTWKWYDPSGHLYTTHTTISQCITSPCMVLSYITIAGTPAATRFGVWTVDLLVGGFLLYSDHFSLVPLMAQVFAWNFDVIQSAPGRVHVDLTITIHPHNQTWSTYELHLPYATNITAFEVGSNRLLDVYQHLDRVDVNLGAERSDGYSFVLNFDLTFGLGTLNGWTGGSFSLTWTQDPWEVLYDVHPILETFNITLPEGATFADLVGINSMALNANMMSRGRQVLIFSTVVQPFQRFGWTIIYRDFSWLDSHAPIPPPTTPTGVGGVSQQLVPVLPLTLGSISLWTAIMSVFLLTGSELISPIYSRTGIIINRQRLRIAALFLVGIFLATTAYQLIIYRTLLTH